MIETHARPAAGRRFWHLFYSSAVIAGLLLALLGTHTPHGLVLGGTVPYAFVLFVLVLLGIGLFHHHTLYVAGAGAAAITLYTVFLCPEAPDVWAHFLHEGEATLLNLGALMLGFTLLADLFERSHLADALGRRLPRHPGHAAFALLAIVWAMSSFLDNIAGAMIGGVMALRVFKTDLSVAFLAAIVAAANAGGAWSVLGDTTTTMMWIGGVAPGTVFPCILGAAVCLLAFGVPAAKAQARLQPSRPQDEGVAAPIDWLRLGNVLLILGGAVTTNVLLDRPFVGVWAMLLLGSLWRAPTWSHLGPALKGTTFLLALVWCASLMPVHALPAASWGTTLALGFLSAVFDNIPLTKLALDQGGYDWALLSYAVGFGGSMVWFGSSAGVTLAAAFPRLRHTGRYLVEGWPIAVAYLAGFFAMVVVLGWNPAPVIGQ